MILITGGTLGDIKTRIRAGNLDDAIAEASWNAHEMAAHTNGIRSTIRTALAQEETTGKEVFANKLRMDSPLNYMIGSLDGHWTLPRQNPWWGFSSSVALLGSYPD